MLGLFSSCGGLDPSAPSPSRLHVVPLRGRVIALDTMPPARVLPLGEQKQVPVGTPTAVPMNDLDQPLRTTVVAVGTPGVRVPGQDSVLQPRVVSLARKTGPLGLPQTVVAQAPYTREYNPFNFTLFGLAQGMVESQTHTMCQDRSGNLWFGTFNGISKFNGKTFENFTRQQGFADNFTQCIVEDRAGNLWFGFRKGVSKYDGKTLTNYTLSEGTEHDYVSTILEDRRGALWITTRTHGAFRLDSSGTTALCFGEKEGLANAVYSMVEDRRGNLWFGTQRGLVKYDHRQFTHYTRETGLAHEVVMGVLEDRAGHLWLTTWGGITKFDGQRFHHVTGLAAGWVTNPAEDRSGRLWFGVVGGNEKAGTIWLGGSGGGLYRIDPTQGSIAHFTTDVGLPDNEVITTLEDRTGTLWFGTFKGVAKYGKLFNTLTQQDGVISNSVQCVLEDRHRNLWVGAQTGGGASYFDFGKRTVFNFSPKTGLSDENVISLYEDKRGNVWFGTIAHDLTRLNADRNTFTQFTDSGGFVTCVLEDRAGNLWYSSRDRGGVFRINRGTNTRTHFTTQQGLCHTQVIQIFQDRAGAMWFGTFGGVSCLDPSGRTFTNYTEREGLNLTAVASMDEDQRGDMWFSTLDRGITRLDVRRQTALHLTEREGLSSNINFGLFEDRAGNLWVSGRTGLSQLPKSVLQALATRPATPPPVLFKTYTPEKGHLGFGFGRYYIVEDHRGRILFPTMNGLVVFDPREDPREADTLTLQLTRVSLFNEPIAWKKDSSYTLKNGVRAGGIGFDSLATAYRIPQGLRLPHSSNFISFDFVGINANTPQTVAYQYQLEGLEKTWSAPARRADAAYGNLSPGAYTFRVRAVNEAGRWSRELRYPFTIRPPWWQTWWAYALYALFAGGLVYAIIQYRVAQGLEKIRATEAIRTKISSDLHDDVGSILSGLAMQSQMMALTAREEQKEPLNELSTMSHDAMERMRDTVWAMDSRKDKYENLIDRMRVFAERNLNLKQITHEFEIEIDDARKFIDPQKRQNVYLIFKEAITNLCKHADATHVVIRFTQEKAQLCLLIHDNGSPKNLVNSDGLGLQNMKMRAAQLGGTLVANYEDGFKVELTVA